jgi:hypothetical protein
MKLKYNLGNRNISLRDWDDEYEDHNETRRNCEHCGHFLSLSQFTKTNKKCNFCIAKIARIKKYNFKADCITYKGGKCQKCGYNKCPDALEFHHLDPNEKDFEISSVRKYDFSLVQNELDKCLLLCSNCHREEHSLFFYGQVSGDFQKC